MLSAKAVKQMMNIGPYRFGLPAGLQLELELTKEDADILGWDARIVNAKLEHGYNSIGLEERVGRSDDEGVEWEQALKLVEGLCGPCSQANTMAFAQAVEAMAQLAVPPRAAYLRLVLAESERITSHLMNAADTMAALSLPDREATLRDLRERLVQAFAEWSGVRFQHGLITYGGLMRNIDEKAGRNLSLEARHIERALRAQITSFAGSKEIASRLAGLGIISADDAAEAGLRGPVARASGVPTDIRADFPTGTYEDEATTVIVQRSGSAFARLIVRLLECLESFRLIELALDDLPHGPMKAKGREALRGGSAIGRVEGPRGEVFCWVRGTSTKLTGLHLSTGSFPTLGILPGVLRDHKVEDLHLLLLSLDLCLPCAAR